MAKVTKELEPLKLDCTVHILNGVRNIAYKKRAPRAIRNIKEQARKMMLTSDVRISPELNEAIWQRGIRHLPTRIRVRFNRKRNEDEDAAEEVFTLVEFVECTNFKGLHTEHVVDEE